MLYYVRPKPGSLGGVSNVAHYLARALAKKTNVTYFPYLAPKRACLTDLLNVYRGFLLGEFDIIHFNVVPEWIDGARVLLKLAGSRGASTVLNLHGIIPIERRFGYGLGIRLRSIAQTDLSGVLYSCKKANRIVVNSEYMRKSATKWYGVDHEKIAVIPNGVDLERFNSCDDRLTLDGDPVVLYLGQLTPIKGVETSIQAIGKLHSELPNVKLHIVGHSDIEDLRGLQLLAKKEGIDKHVIFHGEARGSQVARYYRSADMFVLPSRHEGFGITAVEAMASGIPVIASDIESFQEIITDGKDGLLFRSGDADALSSAILTLAKDSGLRKRLSQAALETVRKYSWDVIAAEYVSLYRTMVT